MRILVIGGGGREHALLESIRKNPKIKALFALPGNGGMAKHATCVPIPATSCVAASPIEVVPPLIDADSSAAIIASRFALSPLPPELSEIVNRSPVAGAPSIVALQPFTAIGLPGAKLNEPAPFTE